VEISQTTDVIQRECFISHECNELNSCTIAHAAFSLYYGFQLIGSDSQT